MKTVKIFAPYAVGQIVRLSKITGDVGRPAKRGVNADGSPRADLVSVRVVRAVKDTRKLSGSHREDGVGNCDHVVAEVVS